MALLRLSCAVEETAQLTLDSDAAPLTDYLDACRRKRNVIDYDNSSVATEADELLRKAEEFRSPVEEWVLAKYRALAAAGARGFRKQPD